MGYARGRYGIEFQPEPPKEETPWLLWGVGALVAIALLTGMMSFFRHLSREPEAEPAPAGEESPGSETPETAPSVAELEQSTGQTVSEEPAAARPTLPVPDPAIRLGKERSRRTNTLMQRWRESVTNLVMEIDSLEKLRMQSDIADLDDAMAQRLGKLNLRYLFSEGRNPWVKTIEVKRGNNATRIANENGNTLACLRRLNGDIANLRVGQRLRVLEDPKPRLEVHRTARYADLKLKEKFFKRYYLTDAVKAEPCTDRFPAQTRQFLAEKGIVVSKDDLAELEMLLPKGAALNIYKL